MGRDHRLSSFNNGGNALTKQDPSLPITMLQEPAQPQVVKSTERQLKQHALPLRAAQQQHHTFFILFEK